MATPHLNFPIAVQRQALARQENRCASCGTPIAAPGEAGIASHAYGERAEAHHVIPHKKGGPVTVENCAILCRSCHYSAHQGGSWRDASIYDDLDLLPMAVRIAKIAALYPHYNG